MSSNNCRCMPRDCDDQHPFSELDPIFDLYANTEGNLIQILHVAQQIYGHLSLELQEHIAKSLNKPLSEISGVISFYSFFSTKPRGEHIIRVCLGTACYVRGGKKIVEALQKTLDIDIGGTTKDGKFTFEIARCIGACGLAPAMMIDDVVYRQVNINKLDGILSRY
ncbi:MAG TPA: NAD(P)H-dependent oxidoreductase subunit E [Clostridia bacterium]|nr:NAD(P)H-dependent oxidoreductase subunit E [Clostridia bacterium]